MWRSGFVGRRQAHQAGDRQPEFVPAPSNEIVRLLRQHARLLRLATGIDLDQQSRSAALPGDLLGQRLGQAWTVQGMNHVEQRHRLARLVGLQGPNQMQLDIRVEVLQRRPFGLGLLHPVLAEHPLTSRDHGFNGLAPERRTAMGSLTQAAANVPAGAGDLSRTAASGSRLG
jgi:hypothetical protein